MLNTFTQWMDTYVYSVPELALLGVATAVGVGLALLLKAWRFSSRLVNKANGFITSTRSGKLDVAGYKILLSKLSNRRRWRQRLKNVLVAELGDFLFSSKFLVLDTPKLDRDAQAAAQKRMERSNADMIVWGEIEKDKAGDYINLHLLRRIGGGLPLRTTMINVRVPASGEFWRAEEGWSFVSYLIANGIQPILATPSAFRREKVKGLVEKLKDIIQSGILDLVDPALKTKIEDEFCAGALHIAEQDDDPTLTHDVIQLRRANLQSDDGLDPDRTIRIKMELGNALIRKSERKYDNSDVSEAMTCLSEAIEMMRRHPRIILAQDATEQLSRAKGLIESRRRFSLSFG